MSRFYFKRLQSLFVFFITAFLVLSGRLAYIQFIQGHKLAAMGNRIRSEYIPGESIPRGNILDRNGFNLTDTGEREAVVIFPAVFEEDKVTALSQVLEIPQLKIISELEKAKNYYANNPFILKTNLLPGETEILKNSPLPGVYILPITSRYGPNSLAVHLVGHLGSIDPASWERLKNKYEKNSLIGVKGLEAIYEDYLRSRKQGYFLQATTDAQGRPLLGLGFKKIVDQKEIRTRNNLYITIDSKIQSIVEDVMDKHIAKGAVVILDNFTGEVLALASRPNFDQNKVDQYLNSSLQTEFLNRALLPYFPGSVFKILVAAAALEEGLVNSTDKFTCSGEYRFDSGVVIPCWHEKGHGEITFAQALAYSCNPVFIEVGLKLGADKIIDYANRFKLNNNNIIGYPLADHLSIDLDNSPAAIGNAVLGQKGIKLSPVQVAKMYAVVANGGIYHEPILVSAVKRSDQEIVKSFTPPKGEQIISSQTANQLKKMLILATTSGTATKAWLDGGGSGGKTSTAQTGEQTDIGREKINAWFAGFAPLENPKYTAVIMVEDGRSGGKDAAPVFREIMELICD